MSREELIKYRDEFQEKSMWFSKKKKLPLIFTLIFLIGGFILLLVISSIYGGNKDGVYDVLFKIDLIITSIGGVFLIITLFFKVNESTNKKRRDEISQELTHMTLSRLEKSDKEFKFLR